MSMRIASTSFIHYTSSIDAIVSILKKGFGIYYCLEEIYASSIEVKHIAIPMVCFCDLPLIHLPSNNYGHYAFGMSRSWGIRQHLLPVSYYPNNKECLSTKVVIRASEAYVNNSKDTEKYEVLGYSKPMYKIQNERQNRSNNNYVEREWRKVYAPNSLYKWKSEEEYRIYRGDRSSLKRRVGNPLRFEVNDIDFLSI